MKMIGMFLVGGLCAAALSAQGIKGTEGGGVTGGTPEPATLLLAAGAAGGYMFLRKRKERDPSA